MRFPDEYLPTAVREVEDFIISPDNIKQIVFKVCPPRHHELTVSKVYYWPEETKTCRQPYHREDELYASEVREVVALEGSRRKRMRIERRVRVEEVQLRAGQQEAHAYIYKAKYDPTTQHYQPLTVIELDDE